MSQSIAEMAKELVVALIEQGLLAPEHMQTELKHTYQSLSALKAKEEEQSASWPTVPGPANAQVDWRKSIKKHSVACLICGQTFKQLSARHLSRHDLNPRSYRERFGIPKDQPLSAKATTAMRKQIVMENRPWEKAPTYGKARQSELNTAATAHAK